jgi:virginiamycin B lyase
MDRHGCTFVGAMRSLRRALTLALFFGLATISSADTLSEFPCSPCGGGIANGPDGNLWITGNFPANSIVRMSPGGAFVEFPVPTANANVNSIASGPDGNVWFTEEDGNKIGRITPSGTITEFPLPVAASNLGFIVGGPDGNLWFTELSRPKIGRITTAGVITEFDVVTPGYGITVGPDQNLWFAQPTARSIGRITPSGTYTGFLLPPTGSLDPARSPTFITGSADKLWFTLPGRDQIAAMSTAGQFLFDFTLPNPGSGPGGITSSPDGNIWFTEANGNRIGRLTPLLELAEINLPTPFSTPYSLTTGPFETIWFTEGAVEKVGRISLTLATSFYTVVPCRIIDTRSPLLGAPALEPSSTRTFQVAGKCDIPPTARSISANVTVVGPEDSGYLTLYLTASAIPPTSNLNFKPGQIRSNNMVAPLAPDGTASFTVLNHSSGSTHFILDVNGYFQ